jgi:hypothetical protein
MADFPWERDHGTGDEDEFSGAVQMLEPKDDVITLLESLDIARDEYLEEEFINIFVTELRKAPEDNLCDICHNILENLDLI